MRMPRFICLPLTLSLALKSARTTAEKAYRIINISTTRDLSLRLSRIRAKSEL
jgi:hypothetical protein